MNSVYCPLGIIHGKFVECVRFNGIEGDTCYSCPLDSMDAIARNLDALVTVLNGEGGLSDVASAIDGIADSLGGK